MYSKTQLVVQDMQSVGKTACDPGNMLAYNASLNNNLNHAYALC